MDMLEPTTDRQTLVQPDTTVPTDTPTSAAAKKTTEGLVTDDDVGKYVAVYYSCQKPSYYWGKITKVFSDDDDTDVTAVEVDFLQKKTLTSDPKLLTWCEKIRKEVLVVETKYIIWGPVFADIISKGLLRFPDVEATARLQKDQLTD